MEKLERASGEKWRKIVVGSGNRGKFEKYLKSSIHGWAMWKCALLMKAGKSKDKG